MFSPCTNIIVQFVKVFGQLEKYKGYRGLYNGTVFHRKIIYVTYINL